MLLLLLVNTAGSGGGGGPILPREQTNPRFGLNGGSQSGMIRLGYR